MSTEIRKAINVIRHDNHVPPASLTKRTFTSKHSNSILMSNTSASTIEYVSFDGTNMFTLLPTGILSFEFSAQKEYWTKGDAAGTLEVLIGSED